MGYKMGYNNKKQRICVICGKTPVIRTYILSRFVIICDKPFLLSKA